MTRQGFFRNLVLRQAKNAGEFLAVLVTRSGGRLDIEGLTRTIAERAPSVKSLWSVENDRLSDVVDYTAK
jgi:23S rRNA (uracil1939-C5)-methyltransferase